MKTPISQTNSPAGAGRVHRFVVQPSRSRKRNPAIDDDGKFILPGCKISFSYGIPPVLVIAQVVTIDGDLWALTPGHNPTRCKLSELRESVGGYYLHNR